MNMHVTLQATEMLRGLTSCRCKLRLVTAAAGRWCIYGRYLSICMMVECSRTVKRTVGDLHSKHLFVTAAICTECALEGTGMQ